MKKLSFGFTLVELLIVIAIIAIVSGVVIAVINPERQRAKVRDAARQKDLQVVALALEQFYADRNQYPVFATYGGLGAALVAGYLKALPNDPIAGNSYCYASPNRNNFVLCATQETDPAVRAAQDGTSCNPTGTVVGRYCVANPL